MRIVSHALVVYVTKLLPLVSYIPLFAYLHVPPPFGNNPIKYKKVNRLNI